MRAVLFTMNIAINRAARPKMEVLLHELRQRRAGTFARGEHVGGRSLVRRQKERTFARRLEVDRATSRGRVGASAARGGNAASRLSGNAGGAENLGPGWGSGFHTTHLSFQQQVGVLVHRDFLQLLAAGHRTHSTSSTAAAAGAGATVDALTASKNDPGRGSVAGSASAVGGARPPLGATALRTSSSASSSLSTKVVSAASLKLDRHSYTRWPLKCGCVTVHGTVLRVSAGVEYYQEPQQLGYLCFDVFGDLLFVKQTVRCASRDGTRCAAADGQSHPGPIQYSTSAPYASTFNPGPAVVFAPTGPLVRPRCRPPARAKVKSFCVART